MINYCTIIDFTNRKLNKTFKGHTGSISNLIKINQTHIASIGWDYSIKIWNLITGNCLQTIVDANTVCSLERLNNKQIVYGTCQRSIKLINLNLSNNK